MPTFPLTTSKVLSTFLLAPSAATPCASSTCSSIKYHFLPRHTLKVRRVLVQSERAEPCRNIIQDSRVEIFCVFLRAAVSRDAGDDRRGIRSDRFICAMLMPPGMPVLVSLVRG